MCACTPDKIIRTSAYPQVNLVETPFLEDFVAVFVDKYTVTAPSRFASNDNETTKATPTYEHQWRIFVSTVKTVIGKLRFVPLEFTAQRVEKVICLPVPCCLDLVGFSMNGGRKNKRKGSQSKKKHRQTSCFSGANRWGSRRNLQQILASKTTSSKKLPSAGIAEPDIWALC
ncbi:hypothetical protein ACMU_16480 [Actibacterium mucosum KCTC 23349]|uniref:Uncharacterized protein n=1 Tax=Actibacterium mucosum KCTC 23349 TaxID=1454373 RepID=A0A037ZIP6_9RHOB|nr:hypothetical protein ACMU_16480 [Actibacterium mucosum KCTC 23349]